MSAHRLTIIVPTFNRCACLELLLCHLKEELQPFEKDVLVYVADNASTDGTSTFIKKIIGDWPEMICYRHSNNVGADRNFIHCVSQVRTKWFWIIGDDDLPKRGVIAQLLNILQDRQPALLYMQNESMNLVMSAKQGEPVGEFQIAELDALSFLKIVNTWVTFISGMVVNRDKLIGALQGQQLNRFDGTSLVQLGWILPLVNTSGPFLLVRNRGILVKAGNTGGYQVLKTFSVNFPSIVREFFGNNKLFRKSIINQHIIKYLPGLIWHVRFGNLGNFQSEDKDLQHLIREQLGKYPLYWITVWPIMNLPKLLAWSFYGFARVISKIITKIDNF